MVRYTLETFKIIDMKRTKIYLTALLSLTLSFLATSAMANLIGETDTLKIIINGETKVAIKMDEVEDLEELKELEEINLETIASDVERAMDEVDAAMDEVDAAMDEIDAAMDEVEEEISRAIKNIEIFDNGTTKKVVIKNENGEVIKTVEIGNFNDDTGDLIEVTSDEDNVKIIQSEDDDVEIIRFEPSKSRRWLHTFMACEIGSNNYLHNGNFPSGDAPYIVKPFGSWSFAIGSGFRAYATNWLSFDLGADFSWYNFKMEDKSVKITEGENPTQINFTPPFAFPAIPYSPIRSKLTVCYVDASLVPMFHIGRNNGGFNTRTYRIGVGAYAGYRIASKTKNVYRDNGHKRKMKNHDNFYLNNFRYGLKAMVGIKEINLFFSYDLNPLFEKGKGPDGKDLNAFSFGANFSI